MKKLPKRILLAGLMAGIATLFYFAFKPQPVLVDSAEIFVAPMEVTIEADGVIRVRDIYTISSPISGHLDRSTLDEGRPVVAGETIVASIHPLDPPFLDTRTAADLTAAIDAARSAVLLANAERDSANTALNLATSHFNRVKKMSKSDLIAENAMDQANSELQLARAQVNKANAEIRLRKAQLTSAQARLIQPDSQESAAPGGHCCIEVTSPIDGVVLKIFTRSEQAVSPGTLIAEVGHIGKLEIAVDLLSADATKIRPGTVARVLDWGGETQFTATVSMIEPSAFTKVSALGIEEQRVNVILDVIQTPEVLGHNYRVVVRIPVWQSDQVTQVPVGALFRNDRQWSVFVVEDNRVSLRSIDLHHLNDTHAEVISGLEAGEKVVVYPSDLLADGSTITFRGDG